MEASHIGFLTLPALWLVTLVVVHLCRAPIPVSQSGTQPEA